MSVGCRHDASAALTKGATNAPTSKAMMYDQAGMVMFWVVVTAIPNTNASRMTAGYHQSGTSWYLATMAAWCRSSEVRVRSALTEAQISFRQKTRTCVISAPICGKLGTRPRVCHPQRRCRQSTTKHKSPSAAASRSCPARSG